MYSRTTSNKMTLGNSTGATRVRRISAIRPSAVTKLNTPYLAFGTDPIEELTNLAEKIYSEFPHSIFFTSKLIFERDNWYIRQLHSEAALTMRRRLHLRNMPMVILPMKL
jgi:hypothetical protein